MPPTVSFTPAQGANAIARAGFSWASASGVTDPVTYAYRQTAPTYTIADFDPGTVRTLTDAQKLAVEASLRAWSNVANVKFSAVAPGSFSDNATILFANFFDAGDTAGTGGFAYLPETKDRTASSREGDVFLAAPQGAIPDPAADPYRYSTIIHEIGHAIGLDHPGEYNADRGAKPTYAKDAQFIEDTLQYTIMSYFAASLTGAQHTLNEQTLYGTTPLLFDVAAVQKLYGANMEFAKGDNVYGFNAVCDPAFAISSAEKQVIYCIWDAGGRDVLDFSGYSNAQRIDLGDGKFSDVGALTRNVSIAVGAVIEDAIGGSGDDSITGNAVGNRLFGGDGVDRLFGLAAPDRLTGGKGNDSIDGGTSSSNGVEDIDVSVYTGTARQYEITVRSSGLALNDRVANRDGTDSLVNIERIDFSDTSLDLTPSLKTATLSKAQIDGVIEIYIASFNRAPDALGLNYWGGRLKDGMGLDDMSKSFFTQAETAAKYPASTTNESFVNSVYGNVLGRASDPLGLTYWSGQLANGTVTRDKFLLAILNGARANPDATQDVANLNNKVAVGEHFALLQGLNNGTWGQNVMAGVTSTASSVAAANAMADGFAATAAASDTSELVVKVLGIVS